MNYWFNFNGIDSRNMGVMLEDPVPVMRGKARVTRASIPGRAGSLTMTEGTDIYETYVQTLKIAVHGAEGAERVKRWLRGEHYVTFHSEPNRRQYAYVESEIKLERVSPHIDWFKGTVQFICNPLKEPLAQPTQDAMQGRYVNEGDAPEKPTLFIIGAGNTTLSVDGREFTLTGIPAGGCYVDCEAGIVLDSSDNIITNISAGEFPYFPAGESNFTWTVPNDGAIAVQVKRKVVYL